MLAMSSEVSEVVATTATALPQVEAVTVVPEDLASDDAVAATEPQPEPEVAVVGANENDNVEVVTQADDETVIETTTLKEEAVVPVSDVKPEDIISEDAPLAPVEKLNSIKEEVKKQVRQHVETANKKVHDVIKKHRFIM
ncbi:unnamed protein product [Orchesella dallaii]|uniref:Uncharacterized protein n=1 Tax=Orchesella dallaii TaxID=48710 RepID=A0ABP1PT01_9HEXA